MADSSNAQATSQPEVQYRKDGMTAEIIVNQQPAFSRADGIVATAGPLKGYFTCQAPHVRDPNRQCAAIIWNGKRDLQCHVKKIHDPNSAYNKEMKPFPESVKCHHCGMLLDCERNRTTHMRGHGFRNKKGQPKQY